MSEKHRLIVNGKAVEVEADRDMPLLYVLRNLLGLKGTRFGCGEGICGSCTVIVDGRAIYSCDTPVWAVHDKNIETIEGLARGSDLHPLQRAFLDAQAGQCGYCLSGIVMRAKALLDENPLPSRAEIVAVLDKNLCRCGAHNRIIRAVEQAAADLAAAKGASA